MPKKSIKKKAKKKTARKAGPTRESQMRYVRGHGIAKTEDGLPLMRQCLYLATQSILDDLEKHQNKEIVIPLRDRVGIFAQFAEKTRLFEGQSTSIEEHKHKHTLVEQIIMIMAEQKKVNANSRLNIQN